MPTGLGIGAPPVPQMQRPPIPGQPGAPNERKRPLNSSLPYEMLDEVAKKEIDQWLEFKRVKEYGNADNMRELLRRKGVDPDTIMVETNWLKKFKPQPYPMEPCGPIPKVFRLTLPPTSRLCMQGFLDALPAVEHRKEQGVFSEATWILQEYWEKAGIEEMCKLEYDPDGLIYPEVNNAWKAAGHPADGCMTVITCPSMMKAAVGVGGKKFGERAAKLAMAIALVGTHPKTDHVLKTYPNFAQVLRAEEDFQAGIK